MCPLPWLTCSEFCWTVEHATPSKPITHPNVKMNKGHRAHPGNSSNEYLRLLAKVALVVLILFLLPQLVESRNSSGSSRKRTERQMKSMLIVCERDTCADLIPEENMNCVNKCLSQACFESIYQSAPLEDGEIDLRRAREFEKCALEELRVARIIARRQK